MLDLAIAYDQRQTLDQPRAVGLEGWKAQRVRELEAGVAQNFKGQMQALGHLALIFG